MQDSVHFLVYLMDDEENAIHLFSWEKSIVRQMIMWKWYVALGLGGGQLYKDYVQLSLWLGEPTVGWRVVLKFLLLVTGIHIAFNSKITSKEHL